METKESPGPALSRLRAALSKLKAGELECRQEEARLSELEAVAGEGRGLAERAEGLAKDRLARFLRNYHNEAADIAAQRQRLANDQLLHQARSEEVESALEGLASERAALGEEKAAARKAVEAAAIQAVVVSTQLGEYQLLLAEKDEANRALTRKLALKDAKLLEIREKLLPKMAELQAKGDDGTRESGSVRLAESASEREGPSTKRLETELERERAETRRLRLEAKSWFHKMVEERRRAEEALGRASRLGEALAWSEGQRGEAEAQRDLPGFLSPATLAALLNERAKAEEKDAEAEEKLRKLHHYHVQKAAKAKERMRKLKKRLRELQGGGTGEDLVDLTEDTHDSLVTPFTTAKELAPPTDGPTTSQPPDDFAS